jgi:putative heme transporter
MTDSPTPPPRVRSRDVWVVLANTIAIAGALAILWELRTVVAWVLVAVFIALALRPAVAWLGKRMRRGFAVAIVALAVLAVVGTLIATFVPLAFEQGRLLVENMPELLRRIGQSDPVRWVVRRFGDQYEPEALVDAQLGNFAGHALAAARSVFEGVIATITITTLTIFMLLFGDELVEKALAWFAPGRREHARTLAYRMNRVVGGYVAGTLIVASIGGVVMGLTLALLGVPYFLPLGLAMIVLGIVPFIGSAIGSVALIGVTLASQGWKEAAIVAVVFLVYQQIENEVLHPIVQRRTIKMNPLLIALVLLAGTALAGVVGTLLALPVAGAIQVVLGDALERRRARWGERKSEEKSGEKKVVDEPEDGRRAREPHPKPA